MSSATNQRQFFRLCYPLAQMPVLTVGQDHYSVPEISERGLRIEIQSAFGFHLGDEITGQLTFYDGATSIVSGVIFRIEYDQCVIASLEGLSLSQMLSEQRRLLHTYPVTRGVSTDQT